ncbi:MAG: peptidylprolyl isomerase [Mucilaginibacter sp.]|nr:peptidylprolyl isomerase [Mucilaginibacter sp.]
MTNKLVLIISLYLVFSLQVNAQDNLVHTPKGALVKVFTSNPGDKIKLNDVITFDVIQKTEKDSVLFSSYTLGHPLKIQVQPSQNAGDLMDVFPLLTAKDSAYVKVPSDSVFKGHEDQRPPFLAKGSSLIFILKISKVQSLDDAMTEVKTAEMTAANKYIADHKLTVTTTASGLKYVITQPSLKRKPLPGDTLLVNYTGRTIDGKVFDSSLQAEAQKANLQQGDRKYEPIKVVVGQGQVIKGWDEGLLLLNEGSRAEFIIPSGLGYGAEGAGSDIAPYSTLVFDVELVKIKPTKPAVSKPAAKKAPAKKHTTAKKKS